MWPLVRPGRQQGDHRARTPGVGKGVDPDFQAFSISPLIDHGKDPVKDVGSGIRPGGKMRELSRQPGSSADVESFLHRLLELVAAVANVTRIDPPVAGGHLAQRHQLVFIGIAPRGVLQTG